MAGDNASLSAGIRVARVRWSACHRIVPSRYPPIQAFERVADPADLDAVFAVEALTNDRVREEAGELARVLPEDRVSGPGSSFILAPFTHVAPIGGRFTDGTFGAYYAARTIDTAIAETKYHRARFMAYTKEPPMHLDMRVLVAELDGRLHDLRGMRQVRAELYRSEDYAPPQALARELRAARSWGVTYESVRLEGGECAAVFRPRALSRCRQTHHLTYVWDGTTISEVYEKRAI